MSNLWATVAVHTILCCVMVAASYTPIGKPLAVVYFDQQSVSMLAL